MGRITAYDQNGRMVANFDKSDYDFLCRYGRTPEEVLDENAKLRELVRALVYASDPSDRAAIICNAAELMAELGVEVDA